MTINNQPIKKDTTMAKKIVHDFTKVPHDYILCLNQQCPKASTCLRQLVEQEITNETEYYVVINQKHPKMLEGECPHYRCSKKVSFAKGFMKIMANLTKTQTSKIVPLLINHFSQRTYYRIRKGERLIFPAEQQEIIRILKMCGVAEPIEFDAYVEDYEW